MKALKQKWCPFQKDRQGGSLFCFFCCIWSILNNWEQQLEIFECKTTFFSPIRSYPDTHTHSYLVFNLILAHKKSDNWRTSTPPNLETPGR
jgi:hypothetical protein